MPKEPTPAMLGAGDRHIWPLPSRQVYMAMLASAPPAPNAAKPLLNQIADLEDSVRAWRRNAELADQDNRRLEQENRELKKEVEQLQAAHESTVSLYSLPGKKV